MRKVLFWTLMCGGLLVAASSRSDVASTASNASTPTQLATPIDEPITGEAIVPVAGSATTPKDPFTPYDLGPASAAWRYQDLSPAEKALADKGRNTDGWDAINSAYANASGEQSRRAASASAAAQLGASNLAETGVVP